MKNKKIKKSSAKTVAVSLCAIVLAGLIGVIIALGQFFRSNPRTVYAASSIEFLFDGAADGVTPDGQKFNVLSISDPEIISAALARTGMTGKYSVDEIRANLFVNGQYPESIFNNMTGGMSLVDSLKKNTGSTVITSEKYNPTSYSIVLYRDFDKKIKSAELNELLSNIIDVYTTTFFEKFNIVFSGTDSIKLSSAEKYDYQQQLDAIEANLKTIEEHADNMFEKKNGFVLDGKSFHDIALKCRSLMENDLQKISSLIYVHSLSKDFNRMKYKYEYYIEELNRTLGSERELLESVNAMIDEYEKDALVYIGSGDAFTKIENSSDETYDKLLEKRTMINENISSMEVQVGHYERIIENIGKGTAADRETVEEDIAALQKQLNDVGETFEKMLVEYNARYFNSSMVEISGIRYYSPKLISGSFVILAVKCAGPLCVLTLLAILGVSIVKEIKKNKNS